MKIKTPEKLGFGLDLGDIRSQKEVSNFLRPRQ